MKTQQAQSVVSISAFIVASIYAYRKLVENTSNPKTKPVPPTGHFVLGFGFTYVILSVLAQAAPGFGGMMAILVTTGDVLVNGQSLVGDISSNLQRTTAATSGAKATAGAKGIQAGGAVAARVPGATNASFATGGTESFETLPYTGDPPNFTTMPERPGDLPTYQPLSN